ncbi:cobalt-zinc-cadmium efflux system outer membrane protein [Pedobacter metabolipauper]|uniref:Cobalt-zinc-cadmium efflux system outer membrane protein n=2 Tax=Pedobacter metabolipauper TaxID=425513 RepID=A0A4R6SQC4_9SPHI|nr:cobalt-zinc-cadmium efflux system outer membrane protein [Pedobacter metabolipauper]
MVLGITSVSIAQDTLKLNLRQAEQLFLSKNYQLIAQQYQTEQAKADVVTARLFDNPQLSYENLFYNHETNRFLETSAATGQYSAALSQLVKLAGKRNKNIQLANTGVKLAEYAYYDLMRTLRYNLRSTFYKAYYAQQSALVYHDQIESLDQLLKASEAQFKFGNVALKDVIRIRSEYYKLKAEYIALLNEIEDLKSTLKLLTNISSSTNLLLIIQPADDLEYSLQRQSFVQLLDSARLNRADLQLAKTEAIYAQNNLSIQKANAIPDIEISLSYDLKGNYPEKYTGLGIKIPVPLFNRNQGEIKKARILIEQGNVNLKQQEAVLENELYNSYKTALQTESLYLSIETGFNKNFEQLITEVTKNFKNRNISLIEFLDFYDSYKESILQLNLLKYERMNAKEEINYVTGSTIFK